MRYLLGIDVGTSGTKTVLFDEKGNVIASESYEYPLYQPQNGWAEQNPADWWNAAKSTVKSVFCMFQRNKSLAWIACGDWDTSGVENATACFNMANSSYANT